MGLKLYREKELLALGFACLPKELGSNYPTFYFSSDITIDGDIEIWGNLVFEGNIHCTGFIRAFKINSSCSVTVDDFISCQKLYADGNVTVNNSLYCCPYGVKCYDLAINGKATCGDITANSVIINGKVEALNIKAKHIVLNNKVDANSIIILD